MTWQPSQPLSAWACQAFASKLTHGRGAREGERERERERERDGEGGRRSGGGLKRSTVSLRFGKGKERERERERERDARERDGEREREREREREKDRARGREAVRRAERRARHAAAAARSARRAEQDLVADSVAFWLDKDRQVQSALANVASSLAAARLTRSQQAHLDAPLASLTSLLQDATQDFIASLREGSIGAGDGVVVDVSDASGDEVDTASRRHAVPTDTTTTTATQTPTDEEPLASVRRKFGSIGGNLGVAAAAAKLRLVGAVDHVHAHQASTSASATPSSPGAASSQQSPASSPGRRRLGSLTAMVQQQSSTSTADAPPAAAATSSSHPNQGASVPATSDVAATAATAAPPAAAAGGGGGGTSARPASVALSPVVLAATSKTVRPSPARVPTYPTALSDLEAKLVEIWSKSMKVTSIYKDTLRLAKRTTVVRDGERATGDVDEETPLLSALAANIAAVATYVEAREDADRIVAALAEFAAGDPTGPNETRLQHLFETVIGEESATARVFRCVHQGVIFPATFFLKAQTRILSRDVTSADGWTVAIRLGSPVVVEHLRKEQSLAMGDEGEAFVLQYLVRFELAGEGEEGIGWRGGLRRVRVEFGETDVDREKVNGDVLDALTALDEWNDALRRRDEEAATG